MITITQAMADDFAALPEIDHDADQAFRQTAVAFIADTPPPAQSAFSDMKVVFVARLKDTIAGFIAIDLVDGQPYLKQISVRQAYSGQGVGSHLIRHAISWAKDNHYDVMTLTTFRDIPFNGPFYQKIGFTPFIPDESWPELHAIREKEQQSGIEIIPRIAMHLNLR